MHGEVYWWDGPNGSGASFNAGPQYKRRLLYTYRQINEADQYRWRKVQCPVCLVTYAGWYVLQPHGFKTSKYTIYDLSYWWAFNDEPDERDLVEEVQWDTEKFREMLRQWHVATPDGGRCAVLSERDAETAVLVRTLVSEFRRTCGISWDVVEAMAAWVNQNTPERLKEESDGPN